MLPIKNIGNAKNKLNPRNANFGTKLRNSLSRSSALSNGIATKKIGYHGTAVVIWYKANIKSPVIGPMT